MKKILLLLFLTTTITFSQKLEKVNKIIYSYKSILSAEELAKKIDSDFKTNLEKIRAIYTWLALNIKYDKETTTLLEAPKYYIYSNEYDLAYRLKRVNNELVSKTITDKKAVCTGYALTFKKLCNLLKIENELIKGYVKTETYEINYIPKNKNHVWNAVKIDGTWLLVDVTYGAGYSINNVWHSKPNYFYFNVDKESLRLTHYPSDSKWMQFFRRKPLNQFCNQPIYNYAFFNNGAELITPKKGEIEVFENKITIKVKNINFKTGILYSFEKSIGAKKPQIRHLDSITSITIKIPPEKKKLYIYFNGESALAYKIKREK